MCVCGGDGVGGGGWGGGDLEVSVCSVLFQIQVTRKSEKGYGFERVSSTTYRTEEDLDHIHQEGPPTFHLSFMVCC